MSEAEKPSPKKPYEQPVLKVYGTVRDITKTVGPHGGTDGGGFPTDRTSTV